MVSIGKPMDNTQLYVLDDQLRKVAPGIHGELYIASSGLAQGYFGRPGLTAERFVTNPFGPPGSLMYRTGDVAAWDHDGNLAFIGRVDDQIKIRGLRVELGEIEAALREHPAVGQAAVIAHERSSGELQLVGYVVGTDTALPDSSADERHVERWRQLYDTLHTESCPLSLGSDFSVWKSSYDGQPIPIEHMRDWTEATAERIRALSPRRVLEIGVGTGLLLAELAPHAEEYWGTDFSAPVIEALRAELSLNRELAKRVVLRTQPATELQLVGYVVATDTALTDSSADERHVERCPGAVAHQPL
jgi:acyl-CoA synthetase (AMP-forming)/AMP-acid ligase II